MKLGTIFKKRAGGAAVYDWNVRLISGIWLLMSKHDYRQKERVLGC